ncbi:MAG: N-acetyltransferase [Paracoccaceae bacterium]
MKTVLRLGLPESLRPDAARLYWQAFGGKLGIVLGPEPRALRFLERVIRADHVIIAVDANQALLGIAGFKTPEGSFATGRAVDLRAIYGPFGGLWRRLLMGWLSDDVDNDRFLLDGLCVQAEHRSLGLGSALLDAICTEAVARGYAEVRLEVVDTNWRAVALYKRLGFVVTGRQNIGLLRHVFGFSSASTMVRQVRR